MIRRTDAESICVQYFSITFTYFSSSVFQHTKEESWVLAPVFDAAISISCSINLGNKQVRVSVAFTVLERLPMRSVRARLPMQSVRARLPLQSVFTNVVRVFASPCAFAHGNAVS